MGPSVSYSNSTKSIQDQKEDIKNAPDEMQEARKKTINIPSTEMKEDSSKNVAVLVWLLEHTQFLRGSEIARLFSLSKAVWHIDNEGFWRMKATRTYPLNDIGKATLANRSWKQYYQTCFDLYGHDGELNFEKIIGIAKDIRSWMKENAPKIHETLQNGADVTELSRFLKQRGCKNRGHLAFWTEIDGQNSVRDARACQLGFFGGFEFYNYRGNMHLLPMQMILDSNDSFQQIENYDDMSHCIGFGGNWSTVQLLAVMMKDGTMRKIRSRSASLCYPQSGGDFVGFMKWYRDALCGHAFRIDHFGGINRMPRNDKYGSESITDGLRIRVRTLYVPETDMETQVTITYEFELDSAPGQSPPEGILKSRHFQISEDGKVDIVNGPGVIGLYPKIGPGMEVFRYNSCTRFSRSSRDCWMEGSFLFRLTSGDEFRANIQRFYFKWRESPIV